MSSGPADLVELRQTPGKPPIYAPTDRILDLPANIQSTLQRSGFSRLYEHQVEAINLALAGEDVVLEAPTASGKTLSFALPMLNLLADDPQAHALMLYPMKAVANDQRGQLDALVQNFPSPSRPLESWLYDGDTSKVDRKVLRERPPSILMTNPEMMHLSFLGSSHLWDGFLRNLRYIVIDEIHEYRGYFGTNFALLLRRFLLKLSRYNCHPQLFLATATCANPVEHARNLTGRECQLVSAKNKMGAPRSYAFMRPGIPDYRFHEIFELRIARAALASLSRDVGGGVKVRRAAG